MPANLNQYTNLYTLAQNGITKRLNKYILKRLIPIYYKKSIPLKLQPSLITAIAYIKNRTYNPVIRRVPFELITKSKPNLSYIKVLGFLTYILDKKRPNKLANKAKIRILVSFESFNNFLVYIPELDHVINSRDVIIKEELKYKLKLGDEDEPYLIESIESDLEDLQLERPNINILRNIINKD